MRILHFLFLAIFTFHFNAQATKLLVPISPEVIEALVENYNGLSQEEKWATIKTVLQKNDPTFLAANEEKLQTIKWPEVKYGKEGMTFKTDDGSVTMDIDDENTAIINGRKVGIKKGNYGKAFTDIQVILETPKTSFFSFLINDAHALGPLAVIIIAAMAIAIWAFVVSPAISVVKAATLRVQCYEIQSELNAENVRSVSQTDANAIRSKATEIITKTERDLAGGDCQANAAACNGMRQSLDCYRRVLAQVNEYHPAVNDDGRSEESFIDRWTPSFLRSRPGSGTSNQ